jgi:hypothetical protein
MAPFEVHWNATSPCRPPVVTVTSIRLRTIMSPPSPSPLTSADPSLFRSSAVLTISCLYLMWMCTYLCQLNPLICELDSSCSS